MGQAEAQQIQGGRRLTRQTVPPQGAQADKVRTKSLRRRQTRRRQGAWAPHCPRRQLPPRILTGGTREPRSGWARRDLPRSSRLPGWAPVVPDLLPTLPFPEPFSARNGPRGSGAASARWRGAAGTLQGPCDDAACSSAPRATPWPWGVPAYPATPTGGPWWHGHRTPVHKASLLSSLTRPAGSLPSSRTPALPSHRHSATPQFPASPSARVLSTSCTPSSSARTAGLRTGPHPSHIKGIPLDQGPYYSLYRVDPSCLQGLLFLLVSTLLRFTDTGSLANMQVQGHKSAFQK